MEIAQGRTDRATLWLVSFTIFPATGVVAYILGKRAGRRAARRNPNRTIEVVERAEDTFERILILLCIFFASILVFRYATLSYVSSAIMLVALLRLTKRRMRSVFLIYLSLIAQPVGPHSRAFSRGRITFGSSTNSPQQLLPTT